MNEIGMDLISQLQEQVNLIASLAFNTFGTLQRDAPPVRLSPNYPDPPNPNSQPPPPSEQQPPSSQQQPSSKQTPASQEPEKARDDFADEPKKASAALVKAAKQFDALVNALPLTEGGEEAQLKRIAELQVENDTIGQELQRQLEAADEELKQVQELFNQASDNCLNMKKPY